MSQFVQLSQRETDVAELLLQGKSNKQIAAVLNISVRAVEFHLTSIYAKLGVQSRTEAALKLANMPIRESAGSNLRETAIDGEVEIPDNGEKTILRRIPMKNVLFITSSILLAIALIVALAFANANKRKAEASSIPSSILTQTNSTPTLATSSEQPNDLCVDKHGMEVCVLAATSSTDKTSVVIQAQSSNPQLSPGNIWQGLVWQTENQPVKLTDEHGTAFSMETQENDTLFFQPLTGNQKVHLVIPSVLASVDLPEQNIVVDVGDDPQPDTIIPLDISVQVFGSTVHFSQATFVGDGVNSLRLTLNADEPVQAVDGITPASLEIGKPDQVDDLYGNGMLMGSKDIFVELIRPNGKVNGTITIPVLNATVFVDGPFEFDLNLTGTSSSASTEVATNLLLHNYFFSDHTLETEDLLYVVWNGKQTDVYQFTPSTGIDYGLFLTLPGHVSSINIHPDRQGLDYLAGIYNKDSHILDNSRLYTLRFSDQLPHELNLFPSGLMLPFYLAWSADGQVLAFNIASQAQGNTGTVGWIDLSCRETSECAVNILNNFTGNSIGLTDAAFSPNNQWIALNGSDSESGAGEIYVLPFNNNRPGDPYNLSQTRWYADDTYSWISGDTLSWICESGDRSNPSKSLCSKEVTESASSPEAIFSFNDWQYVGMAPDGKYFWQVVINRQAEREQQIWLHEKTGASNLLTAAPMFNLDYGKPAFSADGKYLAYTSTTDSFKTAPDILYLVNSATKQEILKYELDGPVGWLGWVK